MAALTREGWTVNGGPQTVFTRFKKSRKNSSPEDAVKEVILLLNVTTRSTRATIHNDLIA
jgi:hypothetical protein